MAFFRGRKILKIAKIFLTLTVAIVVSGSVEARIYDEEDNLLKKFVLKKNDGLILFAGGHGYTILSDDTLVLELKNGPYPGPDKDRRRF